MILTTDAVVLHARRYRESSKIVTLYTRERGKVSVIARGAVRLKSKYRASLEPTAHVSAVIYLKEGRDLQTLSAAEPVERYHHLVESLESITAALGVVELVNAVMHGEDRSEPLFETIIAALRALNIPGCNHDGVLAWFMIHLAGHLGYALQLNNCGICEEPVERNASETVSYSLAAGAPLCAEHRESAPATSIAATTLAMMQILRENDVSRVRNISLEGQVKTEVQDILTGFIRFHVEGLRRLNVGQIASRLLSGPEHGEMK